MLTFGLIWTRHKGDRRISQFQDWAWKLDVLRSGARLHWLTRSISLVQTSLLSDTCLLEIQDRNVSYLQPLLNHAGGEMFWYHSLKLLKALDSTVSLLLPSYGVWKHHCGFLRLFPQVNSGQHHFK